MINSSSEIKDLYRDIKETLKSIELVSIITFIGIFFRIVYPARFQTILKIIDGEMLRFIVSVIDLLFASFLLLSSVTMILCITLWLLWQICNIYSNKMKVYDEKMGNRRNMLQRGFYGSDIRFINLSEWVMVFFGLLFVLDMDITYWCQARNLLTY